MIRATTTKTTLIKMITKMSRYSNENDCRNVKWEQLRTTKEHLMAI